MDEPLPEKMVWAKWREIYTLCAFLFVCISKYRSIKRSKLHLRLRDELIKIYLLFDYRVLNEYAVTKFMKRTESCV